MNNQIPFFGIDRFYKQNEEEIHSTVTEVFSTGKVLMGKEIETLEHNLSIITKRKYAVAVSNCTDALYFALLSAGIKSGDEVITTGYSFIASVTPILRAGAIPVFVDIDPENFMLDIAETEKKITAKTKAIIAVTLYGQALPILKWEELANKYNLILIEDAAQSLGSFSINRASGSMGLISCTSFDPTKIIGAFGTGGALLTDNEDIYKQILQLRYHGKNQQSGQFEGIGFNSQISSLEAALLNLQLEKINEFITKRNYIGEKYCTAFFNINEIKIPQIIPGHTHIFHKFVIQTQRRDELKKYLEAKGIATMIHYPYAIFEQSIFSEYVKNPENFTNINTIKKSVLSLPIYPELTDKEADYICKCVKDFFT